MLTELGVPGAPGLDEAVQDTGATPEQITEAATGLMTEGNYAEAAGLLLAAERSDSLVLSFIQCSDGLTSQVEENADEEAMGTAVRLQRAAFDTIEASNASNKIQLGCVVLDRMVTSYAELGMLDDAVQCATTMALWQQVNPDEEGSDGNPDLSFFRRAKDGDETVVGELYRKAESARNEENHLGEVYSRARVDVAKHILHPPAPAVPPSTPSF